MCGGELLCFAFRGGLVDSGFELWFIYLVSFTVCLDWVLCAWIWRVFRRQNLCFVWFSRLIWCFVVGDFVFGWFPVGI